MEFNSLPPRSTWHSCQNEIRHSASFRLVEIRGQSPPVPRASEPDSSVYSHVRNWVDEKHDLASTNGLVVIIADPCPKEMEDLTSIACLNPRFYQEHLASNRYAKFEESHIDDLIATLPSQKSLTDSVHLHYQRIVYMVSDNDSMKPSTRLHVEGHTKRRGCLLPQFCESFVGLARACISITYSKVSHSKWICKWLKRSAGISKPQLLIRPGLMLVDSTNADIVSSSKESPFRARQISYRCPTTSRLENEIEGLLLSCPPDSFTPDTMFFDISLVAIRIVRVEWLLYSNILGRLLKFYEPSRRFSTSTAVYPLSSKIIDEFFRWRRRNQHTFEKLQLMQDFIELHCASGPARPGARDLIRDIEAIRSWIRDYSNASESMLPHIVSATQLIQAQKGIEETEYVRRLSWTALVFIPLSFVASLFSMNEKFAINSVSGAVRYSVVAFPLLSIVLSVSVPAFRAAWLRKRILCTLRAKPSDEH